MDKRTNYLLVAAAICTVFISCKSDRQTGNGVVSWNGHSIPEDLFVTEYVRYSSSAPVRDHLDTRKEFAKLLLERDIIAKMARNAEFDTLRRVRQMVERAEELSLIKHYIRDELRPNITEPTEKDLREAFDRKNTVVNLDHIFTPGRDDIRQAHQLLKNGVSFDSLASRSMQNVGQPAESYRLGEVSWNQMDLSAEKTAFDLETGEVSKPVRSSRGWHIFRINDKEETYFADGTTFENSKESLGFALQRRQYEEKSPVFVDSVTAELELVTQMKNLRDLWNDLAPRLPGNREELVVQLHREAENTTGRGLPDNTPLAMVDGEPFTLAQFMKRLPNIPVHQLGPDLRTALESAIKDSIFSARARKSGFADHAEVVKDTRIAATEAYYSALVSHVADTLKLESIAEKWYEIWKDQYVDTKQVETEQIAFKDSSTAQKALSKYIETRSAEDILESFGGEFKSNKFSDTGNLPQDHPALTIPERYVGAEDQPLWGPYKFDDKWIFFRVYSREKDYRSYQEVAERHMEQMKRKRSEIVHQEILEKLGYDESDVQYNTDLIRESLPIYY